MNIKQTLIIATIAALTSTAAADVALPSTLTIDGDRFNGVTYRGHTKSHVRIFHESGAASIRIEELPADIQEVLEYDAETAVIAEKEAARRHYIAAKASDKANKAYAAARAAANAEAKRLSDADKEKRRKAAIRSAKYAAAKKQSKWAASPVGKRVYGSGTNIQIIKHDPRYGDMKKHTVLHDSNWNKK